MYFAFMTVAMKKYGGVHEWNPTSREARSAIYVSGPNPKPKFTFLKTSFSSGLMRLL